MSRFSTDSFPEINLPNSKFFVLFKCLFSDNRVLFSLKELIIDRSQNGKLAIALKNAFIKSYRYHDRK